MFPLRRVQVTSSFEGSPGALFSSIFSYCIWNFGVINNVVDEIVLSIDMIEEEAVIILYV